MTSDALASTQPLKLKRISLYLMLAAALLVGMAMGAVIQKNVGFGRVFRSVGFPYPTPLPTQDWYALSSIEVAEEHRGKMALFILAGQSNMVGMAPIPEDGGKSDPRIYVFGNDYLWKIAAEPVDSPDHQVDRVSEDGSAGFGPSLSFGLSSLEHRPDVAIGLIPCAKSSSGIDEWQRNLSDHSLYGSCLKRARAASSMGYIAGVLFFQGEEEGLDLLQPAQWSEPFTEFVTALRGDLGMEDLPVVFAQIGSIQSSVDFPNWEIVREQQAAVRLSNTNMIQTDDLELLDGLHFTADSYRIIGKRFADAYWQIISP